MILNKEHVLECLQKSVDKKSEEIKYARTVILSTVSSSNHVSIQQWNEMMSDITALTNIRKGILLTIEEIEKL